jgi:hypothetical protein
MTGQKVEDSASVPGESNSFDIRHRIQNGFRTSPVFPLNTKSRILWPVGILAMAAIQEHDLQLTYQ